MGEVGGHTGSVLGAVRRHSALGEAADRVLVATGSSRKLVLIVEDEPMLMLSAVQMFEALGFDALVSFTTDEALGHLEGRGDIAVVFAEYDAPGAVNGPGLAQIVRSRWPTIEIVIVSLPRPGAVSELPLGARYFEKPYTRAQIEKALEELGLTSVVPRARTNQPPRA